MTANAGRKAVLVLLANAVGAFLGYVALVLIGRYVDPAAYGAYLFAFSVTGLVALVSNLGLGAAHQRQVAQGVEPGRALGVLVRLRLLVALALLLVVAAGYAAWRALGRDLTDATTPRLLLVALAVHLASGSRQVLLDTWQAQQRVHRTELVRLLDTGLAVALLGNVALLLAHLQGRWEVVPGVGAFWARLLHLSAPPGLEGTALLVAACYLAAKASSTLLAWAWSLRDRVRTGPWDPALARAYLAFALPLALVGALVLVLQYTDTILLGYFWTSREVGFYGAAQKVAGLVLIPATVVGAILFPRFAQMHAAGDAAGQEATFHAAQRDLMLLVVPVAALLAVLPRQVLHIAVGDPYLAAATPLRLLALWAVVVTLEQPMTSRFMGSGRPRLLARSAALNAAANVALNLVLIPGSALGLGPTGAALATLLSTSLSYLYVRHLSRRIHGIRWVDPPQLRILAAGLAAAAAWAIAGRLVGPHAFDRAWKLAGWSVAGAAVYVAALFALGELTRADAARLRRIAHPLHLLAELQGR